MSWSKLCGSGELPKNSMTMRRVDGVDILVVNAADVIYALSPFCHRMAKALMDKDFADCFDGGKPACNKHRNDADSQDGGPAGVAATGPRRYRTKTEGDDVLVDVTSAGPALDFGHATCSPLQMGTDKACLLVNLWQPGFDNKAVRVLSTNDGD